MTGHDQQRDHAEEAYWRDYCPECGASPCTCEPDECAICVPGQCPGQDCPGWLGDHSPDTTDYYECTCGATVVESEQAAHESHCDGRPVRHWQGADR